MRGMQGSEHEVVPDSYAQGRVPRPLQEDAEGEYLGEERVQEIPIIIKVW